MPPEKTSFIKRVQTIHLREALKKNRYPLISIIVGILYCAVSFFAISFIVTNIRSAFSVDERFIQSQIVHFDLATYEKVMKRFEEKNIK